LAKSPDFAKSERWLGREDKVRTRIIGLNKDIYIPELSINTF